MARTGTGVMLHLHDGHRILVHDTRGERRCTGTQKTEAPHENNWKDCSRRDHSDWIRVEALGGPAEKPFAAARRTRLVEISIKLPGHKPGMLCPTLAYIFLERFYSNRRSTRCRGTHCSSCNGSNAPNRHESCALV